MQLTASRSSITQGEAAFFRVSYTGSRGFDPTLTWTVSPSGAGTISDVGIFLPAPGFTGAVTVVATSVFNPTVRGQASLDVTSGDAALHVRAGAPAPGNGTRASPFPHVQAAVDAVARGAVAATIKVAEGTYQDPVVVGGRSVLLLGGFSTDFTQRNAATRVSHLKGLRPASVQDPSCALQGEHPEVRTAITLGGWEVTNPAAVSGSVVDGFTVSHWYRGFEVDVCDQVTISHNILEYLGGPTGGEAHQGPAVLMHTEDSLVIRNVMRHNLAAYRPGAIRLTALATGRGSLVFDNDIEDNLACGDHGGAIFLAGASAAAPHRMALNRVRRNRLGEAWGWGGGLLTSAAHVILAYDIFSQNQAPSAGGAMIIDDGFSAVLDHVLVWGNNASAQYRGGGGAIYLDEPIGTMTIYDSVVVDNLEAGSAALFVDKGSLTAVRTIATSTGGSAVNIYSADGFTARFAATQCLFNDQPGGTGSGNLVGQPGALCGQPGEPAALRDACRIFLDYQSGVRR